MSWDRIFSGIILPGIAVALLALAAVSGHAAEEPALPVKIVGIVYDGPPPAGPGRTATGRSRAGHQFVDLVEMIRQETTSLTRLQLAVSFPESKRLTADWSVEGIHSAIDQLLADPEVDLVLTLGIFATNDACRRRNLRKPVVAPFAIDIDAQSLPVASGPQGRPTTGVANLNYLVIPASVIRDLEKLRELAGVSRIHVLADALLPVAIPEIPMTVIARGRELGLELPLVPVTDSADDALAAIPEDAQAVYITPLNRMPAAEFDRLVQGLIERRLPSFSLLGRQEVTLGVMAGLRPEADQRRLSRRIALNIQRILTGEDAGRLPVTLELAEKLVINMATATAIGVFPRFRVAMEAELIELPMGIEQALTLSQAVREAVEANLSLAATDRRVAAGAQNVRLARSRLRPRLDLSAVGRVIDDDRAAASFGSQAEHAVSGALSLSQVLYSDRLRAGVEIEQHLQRSLERERETLRLDVALDAADAFLNVLRAETLERIAEENRQLTESHLALARRREKVGFSGAADVYRWESRLATDRRLRIAAHAGVHATVVVLNRVLHRPLEELYVATPPTLADPELVTSSGRLDPYVDNAASFALFKEFNVGEGLSSSPELAAIDAAIDAASRAELAARRSFFAPDFGLSLDLETDIWTAGAGTGGDFPFEPANGTDWSISFVATLPLFDGGARRAEVQQASEELSGLLLERDLVAESIELRIRAVLYDMTSTFPSLELAQEAATAAAKNLELVTASYSRGVVSVIDLIDAQNAALIAEAAAANAVYDFLLDLMELQRATNSFDFFRSAAGRDAWFERLEAYFTDNADRIRWPKR